MDIPSLCILSPTLMGAARLPWGSRVGLCRGRQAGWWRSAPALMGGSPVRAACVAFVDLGLSTESEVAFADERPPSDALRERLAHNDRLATLVLVACLAGAPPSRSS